MSPQPPAGAPELFELSEEQAALRETALVFARNELAPNALEWDQTRNFPIETLRRAAGLGMGGLTIAEEHGGAGLSAFDAALIFEALATGCPSIAAYLSIHNMTAWMIDRFGDEQQRRHWLPKVCAMEWLGSYCLTEPGSGSDAAALRTSARRDREHYVLNGAKQFVSGAGSSDIYVTMARTGGTGPGGISAIVVPKDTPGLSFGANERKMGWNAQPTRSVTFENARVPIANRLGDEGVGFKIAMAGLDRGRVNIAACSLGGAQAALDRAIVYMSEREAFGQQLAAFQALQFRIADMATELEAARTLLYRAATKLDGGAHDATLFAAMAKRFVTDVGFNVANEALQLHGGYGYLAETGLEKIVRDLRVHQILEGTNEIMRVIVSRAILGGRK